MEPKVIDDVSFAWPATVRDLMPPWADIPDEFKHGTSPEARFFNRWFFMGANKDEWRARPGIDEHAAWRHLEAVARSFEPKHEHKEAAVAYLLRQWFEHV